MEFKKPLLLLESVVISAIEKNVRLSDISPGTFKTIRSRSGFKKAIKQGLVKVNGNIGYTSDYIKGGETIDIYKHNGRTSKPEIELDLLVLYEDDFLAIVNKPAGMLVSGNKKWTLENALSSNLTKSSKIDALYRSEPIHRLDYPTSGAILVGKTSEAVIILNKMFEERNIQKEYFAITIDSIDKEGFIELDIDDKIAKTEYKVLQSIESPKFTFLNFMVLNPHTGRRHQLRKHMAAKGNPILGDREYGREGLILEGKGLFLHARSLSFRHPFTQEYIEIKAPIPKKFVKLFPELCSYPE